MHKNFGTYLSTCSLSHTSHDPHTQHHDSMKTCAFSNSLITSKSQLLWSDTS